MKKLFSPLVDRVFVLVRRLGPYAAIELLLPGGSLVALLYWWYRQRVSRTRVISPIAVWSRRTVAEESTAAAGN